MESTFFLKYYTLIGWKINLKIYFHSQKWKYHLRFTHLNSFVGNHRLNFLNGNNFWEKSINITEATVPKSEMLWSFRRHYRAILKPFRSHSRVIPESFRSHFRVIPESFWSLSEVIPEVTLESFYHHSTVIPAIFYCHSSHSTFIPIIPESFYCHSSHSRGVLVFPSVLFSFVLVFCKKNQKVFFQKPSVLDWVKNLYFLLFLD